MRMTGKLSPQEFWQRIDQGEARIRAEASALPLFGIDGWTGPRMTGDWGWENDRLVSAGLAHGDRQDGGAFIQVHTTSDDPTESVAGRRMATRMPTIEPDQFPTLRAELRADPGHRRW
ncbi:hypothetical protein [Catenulispora rubra]|uniref:hypothetical protein n=1 Tax=Catenulispora rubra TaxID=280293 RepID=UPI001892034E|nr:hypothetical protein [Catenulispora rubra]